MTRVATREGWTRLGKRIAGSIEAAAGGRSDRSTRALIARAGPDED
jgi:hypothetical protein